MLSLGQLGNTKKYMFTIYVVFRYKYILVLNVTLDSISIMTSWNKELTLKCKEKKSLVKNGLSYVESSKQQLDIYLDLEGCYRLEYQRR